MGSSDNIWVINQVSVKSTGLLSLCNSVLCFCETKIINLIDFGYNNKLITYSIVYVCIFLTNLLQCEKVTL